MLLCESEPCYLGHGRIVSALCLLYDIYCRADHHMHEYLYHFIAACNTRASTALGELAMVIPGCRIDQFSLSFLPAARRLWNLLPSCVFSSDILSSFKSTINLCLQRALLNFFSLFISVSFLLFYTDCLLLLFWGRSGSFS